MLAEIGIDVFYLDKITKEIKKAKTVGAYKSEGMAGEGGYLIYNLEVEGQDPNPAKRIGATVESAHVHKTKEEAEAHKKRVVPLMAEGELEAKKGNERVDVIRRKVIGEPDFPPETSKPVLLKKHKVTAA